MVPFSFISLTWLRGKGKIGRLRGYQDVREEGGEGNEECGVKMDSIRYCLHKGHSL